MTVSQLFSRPLVWLPVFFVLLFVVYQIGYDRGLQNGVAGRGTELVGDALAESELALSGEVIGGDMQSVNTGSGPATGLAATNLESAIRQAKGLPYHQQIGFVTGVFSYLAENRSPGEALEFANVQEQRIRDLGLKTLVAKWMLDGGGIENESEHWETLLNQGSGGLGLEVGLTSFLVDADLDPAIERAWRDAFTNHPGRTEIAARFAALRAASNPNFSLEMDDKWTNWEKKRFTDSVLSTLSRSDPATAWKWYAENDYERTRQSTSGILNSWGQQNPKQLSEAFQDFEDSQERALAMNIITSRLPTFEAMDWAESLTNVKEREYAIAAVQRKTLTGIGASLSNENGYAKIMQIIPGGAIESTSLRQGDLLIETREVNREPVDLYGKNFGSIIGSLRGEYGTTVEIRVLRPNETTGNLEEHTVTVERGLVLP